MTILNHCKEDTLHDHCSPGTGSWCSFQRNVATERSFLEPIKNPLPDVVVKAIKPLFDRLLEKKNF